MNPIIFRLARQEASVKMSNAEWISTIPRTISINPGDGYNISVALVDQPINNETFINISKPVNITFNFVSFITYTENREPPDHVVIPGLGNYETDVPYYCVEEVNDPNDPQFPFKYSPRVKTMTITILPNKYSPVQLATHMTDMMTKAQYSADQAGMPYSSNPFVEFVYVKPVNPNNPYMPSPLFFKPGMSLLQMATAIIPSPGRITNDLYFPTCTGGKASLMMLGCQEVGIEYVDGVFKLFAFTPYVEPKNPSSVWSVALEYNAVENKYISKSLCGGAFFTSITDNSDYDGGFFKKILRIDTSKFCIPTDDFTMGSGLFKLKYPDLNKYLTKPKSSVAYAYNMKCQITYVGAPGNVADLASNVAGKGNFSVIAANVSEIDYPDAFVGSAEVDLGAESHYNISITSIPQANILGGKIDSGLSMILTQQYNYSQTVMGFSDSSVPYIHRGQPLDLQNFHVRILDPSTDQPVPDQYLGPNSYIYLRIFKNDPQPDTVEPEKKDKKN